MKRIHSLLFMLIILTPVFFIQTGCKEKKDHDETAHEKQTYTCPMHPQVVQDKPGTCPICGMDLVPFDKSGDANTLILGASQQALANITTMKAGSSALNNSTALVARLTTDPGQAQYISSRVPGRIENLFVKETGIKVNQGQVLYRIYSEELASLQQEYLVAEAQSRNFPADQRFAQMEKAARQKLLLYGETGAQVAQLLKQQKVSPYINYRAERSGVVAELNITEGQYVSEGTSIMRLENYDQLWVEAEVYPAEAGKVRKGQQVKVIVNGFENQPQEMTIQFINPSLQTGSQLLLIRGTIPNPGNQWQSGMQATVLLPGAPSKESLTLPVDAVIRDENGMHVWVEVQPGKYAPRKVTTGDETADKVQVTSGIEPGESIVITGAYLLYSEYVLKKGKHIIE